MQTKDNCLYLGIVMHINLVSKQKLGGAERHVTLVTFVLVGAIPFFQVSLQLQSMVKILPAEVANQSETPTR